MGSIHSRDASRLVGRMAVLRQGLAVGRESSLEPLIALGTGAAYLYSVAAALFPRIFPESFRDNHTGALAVYFEPAALFGLYWGWLLKLHE